jgi:sarcosine oxidase/N-methyl-L-tryptophan oxidase
MRCGFSGHGFTFGSVLGEIVSQMAADNNSFIDLARFSLKRFE